MDKETLVLIVLSELAILALIAVLAVAGRRLYLKRKARNRKGSTKNKTATRHTVSTGELPADNTAPTYQQCLLQQIEQTRRYHQSLGTRTDIALDLDPQFPEPQRTAALRHALLVAECGAIDESHRVNWEFLTSRYQQILSFYQDYSENTLPAPDSNEFHQ